MERTRIFAGAAAALGATTAYVHYKSAAAERAHRVRGKFIDVDGVRLHYLASWWDVLRVVKQGSYLPAAQIGEVEKFLGAPAEWSSAHGGVSSFPSS